MSDSPNSNTLTHGIRVQAAARYNADDSQPDNRQYLFEYRIRITNEGTTRAKLRSRHWIILDANNQREEVRGPGVVGKHPDLAPGESHEYKSNCPLRTTWGTMEGTYTFEREDGTKFDVAIGRFFLAPTTNKAGTPSSK
ncbi:MAG: Co2+/Mg2+ efflux protein ApaG [Planctomycetes bacterium]|nr:Co2+/Mg2+ efflux protein ApaG [Planctomycetota bacterium]